jgi:hypothetical protein
LIDILMERTLKPDTTGFKAPGFKVVGARSERGYLVVAAEKGIRLKAEKMTGLPICRSF